MRVALAMRPSPTTRWPTRLGRHFALDAPLRCLLILLALPPALSLAFNQAIELAGMVVYLLIQLAAALLFVWALRLVERPQTSSLPAVALFLQPSAH